LKNHFNTQYYCPGLESILQAGAVINCSLRFHIKLLSEIAGRLPSRTAPAREAEAFQIRRRGRQAPGEEFLHSAAFSAPAWQFC
jgi:hypothetical protein